MDSELSSRLRSLPVRDDGGDIGTPFYSGQSASLDFRASASRRTLVTTKRQHKQLGIPTALLAQVDTLFALVA
ncbi:hypothetical protein [Rhodoferax sp.]|uniref:hypothetical protein n=1 Tax=Rhodoferax sp. TaxID=50421 RepID=UPI00284B7E16|nr:hypothetical protein [Rhodoferax sp.]MDR3369116.1 hypothetical protein [Rhodoferax sp.]